MFLCCVELVEILPILHFCVDMFLYSGPSEIRGSDKKQNIPPPPPPAGARGLRVVKPVMSCESHPVKFFY